MEKNNNIAYKLTAFVSLNPYFTELSQLSVLRSAFSFKILS